MRMRRAPSNHHAAALPRRGRHAGIARPHGDPCVRARPIARLQWSAEPDVEVVPRQGFFGRNPKPAVRPPAVGRGLEAGVEGNAVGDLEQEQRRGIEQGGRDQRCERRVLREGMECCGASSLIRNAVYQAVRLGGAAHWG